MITLRKSTDRGHFDFGWLKTFHTFSFGDYHDPRFMGFSVLRVINDDVIRAGAGFPTHGHQDMEILTYIISGALEHKDSLGNTSVMRPGEVQRMSAGTGVRHSEFNHLADQDTHLLQIWILPEEKGISPGYEQKSFETELASGELTLVASRHGRDRSVSLHQDVDVYALRSVNRSNQRQINLRAGRRAWLQVISGKVSVGGTTLSGGDGAAIENEPLFNIGIEIPSEYLLFDLP